jgi:signal transduction histidine kinase
MLADVQLFSYAAAAVLETVLLVALLERRNRRVVALWMVLVALGAWLWHFGSFANCLLIDHSGAMSSGWRRLVMMVMAVGLLLIPSALLHGVVRLRWTGDVASSGTRVALALCYLPLLALVPVAARLRSVSGAEFFDLVLGLVVPYVLWTAAANTVAAFGFLSYGRHVENPRARDFLRWFAGTLFVTAAALVFIYLFAVERWPRASEPLRWGVSLLPVIPALLFAYYVVRFQVVPLVLERTLVYGGIVVGLLLFHRLAMNEVTQHLPPPYRTYVGILEGSVTLALILAYQPLRQRIAESLRYLLGARVATVRSRMRRLAVEMSERAGQPVESLLGWFAAGLTEALHAGYVAGWLFGSDGQPAARGGDLPALSDQEAAGLHAALRKSGVQFCSAHDAPDRESAERLARSGAAFAVRIDHPEVTGLILIGPLSWHRQPGEEERSFLVLLTEQLASTIRNSRLQAERQAAERRALQSEKLATLGLVAGSLAHEIRNPLSSIKTIATVVAEQMGPDDPNRDDLRLILGEIDRLSATTSQLLEFARPARSSAEPGSVAEVLDRLLRLLRLLAQQKNVTVDIQIPDRLPAVRADDQSLREIFFNLLSNSIDATPPGGRIRVNCHQDNGSVIAAVSDNGPGIPAALLGQIFEPFVTSKDAGTGLGLYAVSRRLREIGGDIRCDSDPQSGTTFTVWLPCA